MLTSPYWRCAEEESEVEIRLFECATIPTNTKGIARRPGDVGLAYSPDDVGDGIVALPGGTDTSGGASAWHPLLALSEFH